MTGVDFSDKLRGYANSWLPARDIVVESVKKSKAEVDPTGRIIVLSQFAPWKVLSAQHDTCFSLTVVPGAPLRARG